MHLFIDAGNSCIKYLCLDPEQGDWQQAPVRVCAGDADLYARLSKQWRTLKSVAGVYLADVAGHAASIQTLSRELWHLNMQPMKTQATQLGLHNAYEQPNDLGVDRWLAMLAAHSLYRGNTCVIDCGTAITVDLVDAQGQHQGGLICPGMATMGQSLNSRTHNISLTNHQTAAGCWGRSTQQCVSLGVQLAARSFISEAIEQAREFFKDNVTIVVCGGQAETLMQATGRHDGAADNNNNGYQLVFDQNLVLKGVALAAGFKPCE